MFNDILLILVEYETFFYQVILYQW